MGEEGVGISVVVVAAPPGDTACMDAAARGALELWHPALPAAWCTHSAPRRPLPLPLWRAYRFDACACAVVLHTERTPRGRDREREKTLRRCPCRCRCRQLSPLQRPRRT